MRIPILCCFALAALGLSIGAVGPVAASRSPEPSSGRQQFAAGDFAAAEAAFTRALTLNRSEPSLYYNRALARFNQQKYAEARDDLSAYIALRPKDATAFALRAQAAFLLADIAGALADADAALASDPDNTEALLVRGRTRSALGQTEAALADFGRVMQAQPDNVEALIGRGDTLLARRELTAAKANFARAADLAPTDPDASFKLGLAHFRLLEFAEAIRALGTAAALAPESSLVTRTLGYAQYAAGDHPAAAATFRRAISLDPAGATYAQFALRLSERRRGLPDPVAGLGKPDTGTSGDWPTLIQRYLGAEVTEDYLLLAAQNLMPVDARPGRRCEAHFYVGSQYLLAGNTGSARDHFREAIATDESSFAEHVLARAELNQLKDPPAQPKRKSIRRPQ